jgi:hypothetical protein
VRVGAGVGVGGVVGVAVGGRTVTTCVTGAAGLPWFVAVST